MSTPATYRRYEDVVEKVVGNPKPQKKSSTTYTPPPKQEPKQTVPDTHTMTRQESNFHIPSYVFKGILAVIVAMIVAIVLYAIIKEVIAWLDNRPNRKKRPKNIKAQGAEEEFEEDEEVTEILGEQITEETTSISLEQRANKLIGEGKTREAIRLLYIELLFQLSNHKIITIRKSTTNDNIYHEFMAKTNGLQSDAIGAVITVFNNSWYGKIDQSMETIAIFRQDIKRIESEVIGGVR